MTNTGRIGWITRLGLGGLLAALLLAGPARTSRAGLDNLEAIKVKADHQHFYQYVIPTIERPAVDPSILHKKLAKPIDAYLKAVAKESGVADARRAALEAMDGQTKHMTNETWLLYGDLYLSQSRADYEEALISDTGDATEPSLDPVLEAYNKAAADEGSTAYAWAHYAIALAAADSDDELSVKSLKIVAGSDAVPELRTDVWIRLGEKATDSGKAYDLFRRAYKAAEGERKNRAAINLATAAFLRGEFAAALELAAEALPGPTFEGDDERALRLCVECLANTNDHSGETLPGSLDDALAARVLVALGEYWFHGNVGQHPVEATAAWEAAQTRGAAGKDAKKCEAGVREADKLVQDTTETAEQWLERIGTLCFDRGLTADQTMNCAADVHLAPNKGGTPTLTATVREASASGAEALKACLEGPLPAPLGNASFEEKDHLFMFDNY